MKKERRKRKEKEIGSVATETTETLVLFKKISDSKGWRRKRLAHLRHSLCRYHLGQLRSNTSNSHTKVADVEIGDGDKHRKRKVDASEDSTNFYYYYYSGFECWRGKRRGSNYSSDTNGCGGGDGNDGVSEEGEAERILHLWMGMPLWLMMRRKTMRMKERVDDEVEERNCRKKGRKSVKTRCLNCF